MADIMLYTLSTCGHCKRTKALLKECDVEYKSTDVDLLEGKEREETIAEVKKCNPRLSFPTLVIGDTVIVGFKEKEIREALDQ
ncbi:Glutaredoxin [Desulfatibacillum alkenivorans DSM 16219]|jgi:glutaredoxin|uniref:Glutaredoxin n=1 Tax=Desulfatibacillum alkenivorans DSM 16219 TaxID=1121393 RepID=A0A1M6GEU6_9BACT|nr:glutaredoxin family protein [Desulfatibacillum alkenivorans]SHJ08486.1 Glutaredoxin [Desulfatibacillum alkenivorans DSM 16219]